MMLLFQGVAQNIADALCNGPLDFGQTSNILPTSKHITNIKANANGIIHLIDASIIARYAYIRMRIKRCTFISIYFDQD